MRRPPIFAPPRPSSPIPLAAIAAAVLFCGGTDVRADFTIADFSAPGVNLVYPVAPILPNGLDRPNLASVVGTTLNVTPGVTATLGCVWVDTQESIVGGFVTEFTFAFSPSLGGGGGGSGDGIAFVIHNDPQGTAAIGNHASGIGYGGFPTDPTRGINNSLALEIDDFAGAGQNDPNGNHLSLHTMGAGDNSADHALASIGETTNVPFFGQGSGAHTVRIEYDGTTMQVFFDDLVTPALTVAVDLAAILGGTNAWVGITGSGGGAYQEQNVTAWSFTSGPPPPDEICDNLVDDDLDGAIDCADGECANDPACTATPELCTNTVDDDGDGLTDCADPDCATDPACLGSPEDCDNTIDDDLDGDIDCADADCSGDPVCVSVDPTFFRGDNNGDGGVNIADAVYLLGNLFPPVGGTPNALGCLDAADANADGTLNIADAISLLGSLFGTPAIPLPFPNLTDGCSSVAGAPLGCDTFDACP